MLTFVNPTKVKRKRDPGRCFIRAGFRRVGATKRGLLVFQLSEDRMPRAQAPLGTTLPLFPAQNA